MPTTKSNSRQPSGRSQTRRRARLARPIEHRGLKQLRGRFEAFRSTNPRTANIPVPLRKGVVELLREGVTRSAVERCCGVSWTQMDQWTQLYRPRQRSRNAPSSRPARVLSVIDNEQHSSVGASAPLLQPLELRLGDWSVTVRPSSGSAR